MLTSSGLLLSGLAVQPAAAAPVAAAAVQPAPVTSAADVVSAQAAARVQRTKVLVDDLTTETEQVWANPDGSLTREVTLGPERIRQRDGFWADVDLDLVKGTGVVTSAVPRCR